MPAAYLGHWPVGILPRHPPVIYRVFLCNHVDAARPLVCVPGALCVFLCSGGSVTGLSYVFKPRVVVGAEYKVESYEPAVANATHPRLLYTDTNRHGVRIVVRQVGEFRRCLVLVS